MSIGGGELRVATGRFCQLNCFQEALLPILAGTFGCDSSMFPLLRMIGWSEVLEAGQEGRSPGLFGGRGPEEMTALYEIRWEASRSPSAREAISELARVGPPICKVDRYHVPSDRRWHGRAHRPHSILIVDVCAGGVRYSDADYPFEPALLSWEDLDTALLREPGGELHFARAVASCRDIGEEQRRAIADSYRRELATVLATSAETVAETIDQWAVALRALDSDHAETAGIDVASFINALAKSFDAGQRIAAMRSGDPSYGTAVGAVARHLELCVTRALTFVQTLRPRHFERIEEAFDRMNEIWRGSGRLRAADEALAHV